MFTDRRKSKSLLLTLIGVMLLFTITVILYQSRSKLLIGGEREHGQSLSEKIGGLEISPNRPPPSKRDRGSEENRDSPLQTLSPRLRTIVQDLETRAQFMDSPLGFSSDEERDARSRCKGIIEDLNAEEVSALIRFYRSPEASKLPLMGNELVGSMLYEQWGKVDGEGALRAIESWIVEDASKPDGNVDLTDPFQMNPGFHEVGRMLSGWGTKDRDASLRGLRRLLDELGRRGTSTDEFEAAIVERFPELLEKEPQVR